MNSSKKAAWARAIGFAFVVPFVTCAPAPAQPYAFQLLDRTDGTVQFHDTAFDDVAVEVRAGATEEESILLDSHVLKKGETWGVTTNLQLFWRRELHPGSGDGQYTAWQRVRANDSSENRVDLTA
jgi:hypothetical protein